MTDYTHNETLDMLAVWEEMLNRRSLLDEAPEDNPFNYWLVEEWEINGSAEMRDRAIELGTMASKVWDVFEPEHECLMPFDWEFVPAFLDALGVVHQGKAVSWATPMTYQLAGALASSLIRQPIYGTPFPEQVQQRLDEWTRTAIEFEFEHVAEIVDPHDGKPVTVPEDQVPGNATVKQCMTGLYARRRPDADGDCLADHLFDFNGTEAVDRSPLALLLQQTLKLISCKHSTEEVETS